MPDNLKNSEGRKTRKDKEVSPIENIRQPLSLVRPKGWIALLCLLLLLTGLIFWSFIGRIPTEVLGKAIALNPRGVFSVSAKGDGTVTHLHVKPTEIVHEGTPIATIYNPQIKAILDNIEKTLFKIKQLEAELAIIQNTLETREQLFQEGLIAKRYVEDSQNAFYSKQIDIAEAKGSLANLMSDLEKVSSLSKGEFSGKKEKILAAKKPFDREMLQENLSLVKSTEEGKILEILVKKGDIVQSKQPLAWVEAPGKKDEPLIFYGFVNVQEGKKIQPGMRVQIEPSTVNPQEYGAIIGKVREVSHYALSEEELYNVLRNRQLLKYLSEGATAVNQITIDPEVNPNNPSGYEWTSGKGPSTQITTGTVGNIKIIVEEQPPISYLIPTWKIKKVFSTNNPDLKPNLPPMNRSDSNSFPLEARKNISNMAHLFSEPLVRASREKINSNMTAFIGGKLGLKEKQ